MVEAATTPCSRRAAKLEQGPDSVPPSMPAWFRQHGYTTVSVGKVSHHPGGRGGKDWDDNARPEMPLSWDRHLMPTGAWQHPRRLDARPGSWRDPQKHPGDMDVFQSVEGPDSIYPDGLTSEEALKQLDQLAQDRSKPFFLAVGIIRPPSSVWCPGEILRTVS